MDDLTGLLLSILAGFIPMFLFAAIVYWTDRYEKEPRLLLVGVFVWGAVIAALGAFFLNTMFGVGVYLFTGSDLATELTTGSVIAPIIEEILKGFAVLLVFIAFRNEFDSILDGIVYAAITALGFAATENAYYIFTYGYLESGSQGLLEMFLIRVLLVGWQHPFYTAFTGIGIAIARLNRNPAIKVAAPLFGLSLAVSAHSFHNTVASFATGLGGIAAASTLDWAGWFLMLIFVGWALYREQRWITSQLREEVTLGVITPSQYRIACSSWNQVSARLAGVFSGKYRSTARFYQLTAELAHKKQQLATLGDEKGNTTIVEKLRTELSTLSLSV